MFAKPAEMLGPPTWLHYVRVDSTDAAAARVTANGGTVINGPMDVPGGGRIAQCVDPQGAIFAVHSSAPAAQAAPKPAKAKTKAKTKAKAKAKTKAPKAKTKAKMKAKGKVSGKKKRPARKRRR